MMWLFLLLATVIFHEIDAITLSTKDKDDLQLNQIQEAPVKNHQNGNTKDGTGNETQEKRTFSNPEVDRKGSFYPSGPNFAVGTSINVGNNGYTPNYHTSGNGYSYGAPGNPEYPPVLYNNNYPPSGPNSGAPNFSERNYNFGSAPSFGHSSPSFGYGHPNGGGSGYGGPNLGNSGGSGYGAPNLGSSGGSGYGAPSLGGGGGFGVMSHHGGGQHPLKGLLFPIAGFALLGAAAALAKSHPVLLQLGVIHGRKRRSVYPANPFLRPDN